MALRKPARRIITYHSILTSVSLGAYSGILGKTLAKRGIDLHHLALPKSEAASLTDFYQELAALRDSYGMLPLGQQEQVHAATYENFQVLPGIEKLQQALGQFLDHFAHFSDNTNDFSSTPWRDRLDHILRLTCEPAPPIPPLLAWADLPLSRSSRWMLTSLFTRYPRFLQLRYEVNYILSGFFGLLQVNFGENAARSPHFTRLLSWSGTHCARDG
jgi:hypothetical protein